VNKVYSSPDDAVADIPSGAVVALGGFFTCGTPTYLTKALARLGVRDLTIIIQSFGVGALEVNELVENGQVKKVIGNYPFYRSAEKGSQHRFEQLVRTGKIAVEVYPMGTFVEKMRAGGAGIAAFYTPTGAGTLVAEGKETRLFNGREYVLETALKPDFALVHAWKGDAEGNLTYRKTARNYNVVMAMSAAVTIAEVEQLVEPGQLDPDCVHTPGIYVQRVVRVDRLSIVPSAD
jgi:3-oxoacid CoA-transferase subunit A